MAKLTDTQKDEGYGSFDNFVITKTICKDPWGRLLVIFPSNNTMSMHVLFENYFSH